MSGVVLQLDDDGDIPVFTRHVEGIEATAQKVRTRLLTHPGEWVLDKTVGLPFLSWLSVKDPPVGQIAAQVQAEIEDIDSVIRVEDMLAVFDPATEQITITGNVFTEDGQLAVVVVPGPSGNSNPFAVSLITVGPIA